MRNCKCRWCSIDACILCCAVLTQWTCTNYLLPSLLRDPFCISFVICSYYSQHEHIADSSTNRWQKMCKENYAKEMTINYLHMFVVLEQHQLSVKSIAVNVPSILQQPRLKFWKCFDCCVAKISNANSNLYGRIKIKTFFVCAFSDWQRISNSSRSFQNWRCPREIRSLIVRECVT